jgi:hypothetical protein
MAIMSSATKGMRNETIAVTSDCDLPSLPEDSPEESLIRAINVDKRKLLLLELFMVIPCLIVGFMQSSQRQISHYREQKSNIAIALSQMRYIDDIRPAFARPTKRQKVSACNGRAGN